jgi:hypothetical protein
VASEIQQRLEYPLHSDLTKEVSFYLRGEEYAAQIEHFVDAIKSRRIDTRCTFRSAADADLVTAA